MVDEAPVGDRHDLSRRRSGRHYRQPVHRPRLDAAGGSERARASGSNCPEGSSIEATKKLTLEIGKSSRRFRG